jgi:nucleotide-binding universal stress UspA family protein
MTVLKGREIKWKGVWEMKAEKMKLLIGYDGSACAEAALDDMLMAGLPSEAFATVISVAEEWMPPPPPSSYEIVEAAIEARSPADLEKRFHQNSPVVIAARELAQQAQKRLQINFPRWEMSVEASLGSPAKEIIQRADEIAPDLIIIGSHGRTAIGRFVLGSVSQKIVTESKCSVRIARGRVIEDKNAPAHLIIGVDGSPEAEEAVRAVCKRKWPEGSSVRAVAVEDKIKPSLVGHIIPPVVEAVKELNRADWEWARKMVEKAAAELQAAGLKATGKVIEGNPKRALVEEAENWGADCIFVGSTGSGNRFKRFLLGSVSAAVAARAHCSVEVVRTKEAESTNSSTPA